MNFFKQAKDGFNWIGNKAKSVSKWIGDNKKNIRNIADKVSNYAGTGAGVLGGALLPYNPVLAAGVASGLTSLSQGAGFVRDKIDEFDTSYRDKIQKKKKRILNKLKFS